MSYQQKQMKPYLPLQSLKRQQGVVIVVALFIVALVATMAYVMMSRLERDTRRTTLLLRNTQAEAYAQGSIAWAMDELRNNWESQKPNQLIDATPIVSPVIDVNGYQIKSIIYDMQGRFNLNNLTNTDAQESFKRLIQTVDPEMSEQKARDIIRAMQDWITPVSQNNEFSQYYLELPVPYRAAHRAMITPSEMRLVKGVTPTLYRALQPYITALPKETPLNIQSASAMVLQTLSLTMNLETANAIVAIRNTAPFVSIEKFLDLDIVKNHHLTTGKATVTSSYFLVETDVSIENQHILLYTLLERATKEKKAKITPLWQSKGSW